MSAVNHPLPDGLRRVCDAQGQGGEVCALLALLHMGSERSYSDGAVTPYGGEAFVREVCRDAAAQPTSLLLEQWASMLLGSFWQRRELADGYPGADSVAVVGEPFLKAIARIGNREAKVALLTLARLDR